MTVVVCLDDRYGRSFMGKRLSRDIKVLEDLIAMKKDGGRLYASTYGCAAFPPRLREAVEEGIPQSPGCDDILFLETGAIPDGADKLIAYRWNRHYPSDDKYDPIGHGWRLTSSQDFPGASHDKITKEVYTR